MMVTVFVQDKCATCQCRLDSDPHARTNFPGGPFGFIWQPSSSTWDALCGRCMHELMAAAGRDLMRVDSPLKLAHWQEGR